MFLNLSLFHFPHIVKDMVFPEVMYGCESWTVKKNERWRVDAFELWTVMLEKTLEGPLDSKDIKPVNPKGNQPWIFIGRTDAETEASVLWPTWFEELTHWKRSWCWEILRSGRKGGDRMRCLNGITNSMDEFEQTPKDSEEQGSLACCSPWVAKNRTQLSDWTATKPSLLYSISIRHRLLLYGWCHFIWKGITTLLDMEKVRVWKASILFVKFVVVLQRYLLCYLSIHAPTPRIIGNI